MASGIRTASQTDLDLGARPHNSFEITRGPPGVYLQDCTLQAIEFVNDGKMVDLNRIPLLNGAKIMGQRFLNK